MPTTSCGTEAQLQERGIKVHWVDRGGDVTYHGPGQLVGYPLLPLGRPEVSSAQLGMPLVGGGKANASDEMRIPQADYVGYIRKLEEVLIVALAHFGLVAGQMPGLTGAWIQPDVASRCPRCKPEDREKPAKIAAIGVKVDARGVSRHGFALNVNPDMTYWDGIVACGLTGYPVVSLADLLSTPPEMQTVKNEVRSAFDQVFDWESD